MEISLYSELGAQNNLETDDSPFFFATKIPLSDLDSPVTFEDLYVKIIHKLELDPPEKLKGKVYSLQLNQIKYWAQNQERQLYQLIRIPSDLNSGKKVELLLAQKDGVFKVHFYATHIQIGTVSLVKAR